MVKEDKNSYKKTKDCMAENVLMVDQNKYQFDLQVPVKHRTTHKGGRKEKVPKWALGMQETITAMQNTMVQMQQSMVQMSNAIIDLQVQFKEFKEENGRNWARQFKFNEQVFWFMNMVLDEFKKHQWIDEIPQIRPF